MSFGAGTMVFPHGVHVDKDGNIWMTDGQDNLPRRGRGAAADAPLPPPPAKIVGHQVLKFSPDGRLLQAYGKPGGNQPGQPADPASFYQPNDVITYPNGNILVAGTLSPGQPVYVMLYAGMIVFFCFFYTALVFNSRETADNLKKSGAFIPGIRPGEQTARYIDKILGRLTLVGAVYITLVCLLPEFLNLKYNVPFYFGGTSLLIIVVVTMDFWAQVQSYVMSQQYESLLKKANFKAG